MNLFGNEFKELIARLVQSTVQSVLITGLNGSGKVFSTKRALEDAKVDFHLINDAAKDISFLYKTISKAPDKNYMLDVDRGEDMYHITPIIDSNGKHEVLYKTAKLEFKFVFTGKLFIVTTPGVDKAISDRCFHIEGDKSKL
jgi:hypothetical protein